MSSKPKHVGVTVKRYLTPEEWRVIQAAACAGEPYERIGKIFGVKANTIRDRAKKEKWATPNRIAQRKNQHVVETDDPASVVAAIWNQRADSAREEKFQNAGKALKRFFALNPIPTTWQEAAIADKMLNDSINPPSSTDSKQNHNVNIAILTSNPNNNPHPIRKVSP